MRSELGRQWIMIIDKIIIQKKWETPKRSKLRRIATFDKKSLRLHERNWFPIRIMSDHDTSFHLQRFKRFNSRRKTHSERRRRGRWARSCTASGQRCERNASSRGPTCRGRVGPRAAGGWKSKQKMRRGLSITKCNSEEPVQNQFHILW